MCKSLVIRTVVAIGGGRRIAPTVAGLVIHAVEYVIAWNRGLRDRRLLAWCDERTRRDIGIEAAEVDSESTMSFWRVR